MLGADPIRLRICVENAWSPTIGDPTPLGFGITAGYGLAALLCFFMLFAARASGIRMFWFVLFLVMLFLGANKQLDLQTAINAYGRCHAELAGWFDERRDVQFLVVVGLGVLGGAFLLWMLWRVRKRLGRTWMAILGIIALLMFVGSRAAVLSKQAEALAIPSELLEWRVVLEITGIALIAINAFIELSRDPRDA